MILYICGKDIKIRDELFDLFKQADIQRRRTKGSTPKDLLTLALLNALEEVCIDTILKEINV